VTIEELIRDRLDPEEFIDILGVTIDELTDIFSYEISQNEDKFKFLEGNSDG